MHNGGIPYFSKIKLKLLNLLSERFFQEVKGSTDSEHLFVLFLTILYSKYPDQNETETIPHTLEDIVHALNQTISTVIQLCMMAEIEEACSINLCVTDGVHIVATRYRNGPQHPPSLYYNFGSNFCCENGVFYAKGGTAANDIVISSAPLSKVNELPQDHSEGEESSPVASMGSSESTIPSEDYGCWVLMPKDSMLICRGDPLNPFRVQSIELKPVLVTELFPGYNALQAKNTTSSAGKAKSSGSAEGKNDSIINNSYFPRLSAFLTQKPSKILKFRSKL